MRQYFLKPVRRQQAILLCEEIRLRPGIPLDPGDQYTEAFHQLSDMIAYMTEAEQRDSGSPEKPQRGLQCLIGPGLQLLQAEGPQQTAGMAEHHTQYGFGHNLAVEGG
jgi:hypothetical protein